MKIFVCVLIAAFAVATAEARASKGVHNDDLFLPAHGDDEMDLGVEFSCEGRKDGSYANPKRCSAYIRCIGEKLYEEECGACHGKDLLECPKGVKQWSSDANECVVPEKSDCGIEGSSSSSSSSDEDDDNDVVGSSGEACDPELCEQEGYCDWYLVCDRKSRTLVKRKCGEDLWWNKEPNVKFPQEQQGVCDMWDRLSNSTQEEYQKDEDCDTKAVPCDWWPDENCDNQYWYLPKGSNHRSKAVNYTCPDDLWWNDNTEQCGHSCTEEPCNRC